MEINVFSSLEWSGSGMCCSNDSQRDLNEEISFSKRDWQTFNNGVRRQKIFAFCMGGILLPFIYFNVSWTLSRFGNDGI